VGTAFRASVRPRYPRLIGTENTRRCPSCGYTVRLRLDERIIVHKTASGHCPGSGEPPAGDVPLACWLPVKGGLTPHGLRHSHKTWMSEDGIPEILA
jgi:integrase